MVACNVFPPSAGIEAHRNFRRDEKLKAEGAHDGKGEIGADQAGDIMDCAVPRGERIPKRISTAPCVRRKPYTSGLAPPNDMTPAATSGWNDTEFPVSRLMKVAHVRLLGNLSENAMENPSFPMGMRIPNSSHDPVPGFDPSTAKR